MSRYRIDVWIDARFGREFPWGTLFINLSGCFLLGMLVALFAGRLAGHPDVAAGLTVGFLGAYTTFSTFAYQTTRLVDQGFPARALTNVVASVAAGLLAAWSGLLLGRALT